MKCAIWKSSVKAGELILCCEAYASSLSWGCSACLPQKLALSFTWTVGLAAHLSHHVRIKRVWPRVMTSPAGNWGMFSHFLVRRVSSPVNDPSLIGLSPPDLWRVHRRGQIRVITLITEIITPAHELLLNSLPEAVEILCDSNTTDVFETKCKNLMSSSFNGEKKETRFSRIHCKWVHSLLKSRSMQT